MKAQALYDPINEHDACGVGLVANINNVASHQIVLQGITVLKRLMHRGAAGGDPETGDGAGLLLSMPHKFFRKLYPELPAHYQCQNKAANSARQRQIRVNRETLRDVLDEDVGGRPA